MLETGQAAAVTRRFSAADVAEYVALGGAVPRPGTVPEPLIGALFSYLLGVKLPGPGTNYLRQTCVHSTTARVGEALTARVEITRIRADKHLVDLSTTCLDEHGTTVCTGHSLVLVRDVAEGSLRHE